MPANSPNLVIGGGNSGEMLIGAVSLGCIVGDLSLGKRRNIRDYQTLCDALDGVAQGTPGQLTITGGATVEFIVNGAGINAADAAIDSGAVVSVSVKFSGQGPAGATDNNTFQAYIDEVSKSVSPGAATGQVRVSFRAISQS